MSDFLLVLIYLTLLLSLWRAVLWQPRDLPGLTRRSTLLIGHRGVRGPRPENTLEAFAFALEAGLDGIETDLQRSRDGMIVLYHDFELEGERIDKLDVTEIRRRDGRIPRLEELFELARRHPGTLLNLEIKSDTVFSKGLERDTVRAIRRSGLEDRIIVSSFNPLSLLRVRLLAPSLRIGLLYAPDLPAYLRSGGLAGWLHADAIHPHESQVTQALLRRARRRGVAVNTWTVNDPMRISSLYHENVAAIIGDTPADLLAVRSPEESDREA